jgi:hypothetical protein
MQDLGYLSDASLTGVASRLVVFGGGTVLSREVLEAAPRKLGVAHRVLDVGVAVRSDAMQQVKFNFWRGSLDRVYLPCVRC